MKRQIIILSLTTLAMIAGLSTNANAAPQNQKGHGGGNHNHGQPQRGGGGNGYGHYHTGWAEEPDYWYTYPTDYVVPVYVGSNTTVIERDDNDD